MSVAVASHPVYGALGAIQPNGFVNYTPVAGFSGADSFTFSATSRGLNSGLATASLSVAEPPAPAPAGPAPAGPAPAGPAPVVTNPPAPIRITATVSSSFKTVGRTTRVRQLVVTGIPAGARVAVSCSGPARGCPFKQKIGTVGGGRSVLTSMFTRKVLRAGAVLEIRITVPDKIGQVVRYTVRRDKRPRATTLCVQPGASSATRC
jgi:hypothetical protein